MSRSTPPPDPEPAFADPAAGPRNRRSANAGRDASRPQAPGPRRIQLRREAGWRKPPDAVVVSRPTRWSNPYRLAPEGILDPTGRLHPMPPDERRPWAVARYRADLLAGGLPVSTDDVRGELAGRDLACWCPLDEPCHVDVLLEIANPSP